MRIAFDVWDKKLTAPRQKNKSRFGGKISWFFRFRNLKINEYPRILDLKVFNFVDEHSKCIENYL